LTETGVTDPAVADPGVTDPGGPLGGPLGGPPPEARAGAAYWELAGLDAAAAHRRAAGRVEIVVLGRTGAAEVLDACAAAGLDAAAAPAEGPRLTGAAVTLVVCDDYLDPALAAVDAAQRAAGRPWLLVRPRGAAAWIGPLFRPVPARLRFGTAPPGAPEQGPCWHCLAYRLRENRGRELSARRAALRAGSRASRPDVSLPVTRALGLHSALLEIAKWLAGYRHPGQDALTELGTLDLSSHRHPVQRRPQCASCGDPAAVAGRVCRPLPLAARPKVPGAGGGHRSMTPRQVRDAYAHLVSPLTGAVAELRREPGCPDGLHSWVSGLNPGAGAATEGGGLRRRCGGKGPTEDDAVAGALCEALERSSARFHGDEPRRRDTPAGLGADAVPPDAVQLYHARQFTGRASWNAAHDRFQHVCEPFDPAVPIDWTPVWSLTAGRHRMLPTGLLYLGAPPECGRGFVRADSNGNAAGSSLEDAVVQGFLELVERDAVAMWWYNRTRQPAVDLDSVDDRWLDGARETFGRLGRDLWALDLTADFGVPVFAAVSRRHPGAGYGPVGARLCPEEPLFGFGAHFDPAVALRRAVCELAQFSAAAPRAAAAAARAEGRNAGAGEESSPGGDAGLLGWLRSANVADQPYLLPDPGERPRTMADFGYRPRADLLEDVRAAERLVSERGMELLVLDQTRPDLGLPVVKVIVPGMRSFWARFGEGRLYDVPVHLGRLDTPTPFDDLNPVPLFV
jgi:ribosomal protein S12 methylthiotransferase accessory factor